MKYSERILETVNLLEPATSLADIGCDHGYMAILAAQRSLFQTIYACDVKSGPLSKAAENIQAFQLEATIQTILSDGFSNVPKDVSSAVICGMGGLLIRRILENGMEQMKSLHQLVLGPHSETEELREFILQKTNFGIYRETALLDAGKHYVLMDVRPKDPENKKSFYCSDKEIRFGTILNQTNPAAYVRHLEYLLDRSEKALSSCSQGSNARSENRAAYLEQYIAELKEQIKRAKETD